VRARVPAGTPILVSNLPDLALAPAVPEMFRAEATRRLQEFNRAIAAAAARHNVPTFDVFAMSRAVIPTHPEFFSADGFHPSDAGYEFWAAEMWKQVQKIMPAAPSPP
jgi:lysophospholipase L1-like esterase